MEKPDLAHRKDVDASVINMIPKLVPILTRRIKEYHQMFSLPLIAEMWEETLSRSFEELGHHTTWTPDRSHRVGEDMRIKDCDQSRISCKSGQFVNNRELGKMCVKFNGSRSTRFETLEEKISHFSESHDDYYFLLAKDKKFDQKYQLLIFESPLCRVDQLTWTESASGKQWRGTGPFCAEIGKAMSAQLWTTLPIDMITHRYEIDCRTKAEEKDDAQTGSKDDSGQGGGEEDGSDESGEGSEGGEGEDSEEGCDESDKSEGCDESDKCESDGNNEKDIAQAVIDDDKACAIMLAQQSGVSPYSDTLEGRILQCDWSMAKNLAMQRLD